MLGYSTLSSSPTRAVPRRWMSWPAPLVAATRKSTTLPSAARSGHSHEHPAGTTPSSSRTTAATSRVMRGSLSIPPVHPFRTVVPDSPIFRPVMEGPSRMSEYDTNVDADGDGHWDEHTVESDGQGGYNILVDQNGD